MSAAPYAELHCHSAYSFLDGASLPAELAGRAQELGYEALALTDHNSVSGSMELAQALANSGVRALHGAEIDLAGGRHLTLLVRDARGWRNLCRLLTIAHSHTREGRGRERGEPSVDLGSVLAHSEGLVCLTGCATRGAVGGARDEPTARRLLEAFGPRDLRVELQRPYARHDRARNRALEALARRLGVQCVATGNVHAHARRRAELQDAFVALRQHTTLDASEPLRRGNHSHVMSAPGAMASRFADHPGAVRESARLAQELCFDLTTDLGYRYPGAEDAGATRRLAELCQARLQERYGSLGEAAARLEEELRIIDELGLSGFFLLHHELLEMAREVAVEVRGRDSARALLAPGRGRGSSVSSIVCYLTGLSHIDPIQNRLLLGRFLHTGLEHLPDIDLDFPREIREILIPRVHERYGRERAALVAAFPTFRARGAIREMGKVLGLPPGEIERVARAAEHHIGASEQGIDLAPHDLAPHDLASHDLASHDPASRDSAPRDPAFAGVGASPRWAWLARLVAEAQRLPRHLSQHSGGMVLATRPLIDCCPVVPAAMEGRQMVQWDKDSCADAGLLKIDLLGLGMLSAVERCVDLIARARGERIDLSRIAFDDAETFKAIRRADTVGVFQIESRAQMQSLKRTLPRDLDDLTIQVAIVRPGPIQGGAINPYIERRRRLREDPAYEIPYPHPALRPALEPTLGTVIFQDQVMEVAQDFAGFSVGEAEGLRRAMSRKRSEEALQSHRERFLDGARRHVGADEATAQQVWEMVSGFAGFGFPKAHGAAFGLLAYQSTWLRVHYGPEFLCALMNEQPMGFYAPDSLVHEAEGRGIAVLGLDVNASAVQCTVERVASEEGAVLGMRLGLGYVKGVVAAEVCALVAERERGGRFGDLGELAARCGAGHKTLERLAWSGACDGLVETADRAPLGADTPLGADSPLRVDGRAGGADAAPAHRRLALWQLGIAAPGRAAGHGTQLALPLELPSAPSLRPLSRWQRLLADYAATGVTVGDHVMAALRPRLTAHMLATSAQLARLPQGCAVAVAGLVIARQRPGTAKGTMFLLFEDEWGTINLVVPRAVYERHRPLARAEPLLLAHGRLERTAGERTAEGEEVPPVVNVIVRELAALERFVAPVAGEGTVAQAQVHHLPDRAGVVGQGAAAADREGEGDSGEVGAALRAVAPAVQSFAAGRRR
ncbi:MAG TPA: DNA polymerase III subunit alpha [Solirubrobacteraceae bacterium]|jgi:error-prone DNA polymerase|nr:DNA polymerase III subunit alpha [Solirubrobacteraceae bacterium]